MKTCNHNTYNPDCSYCYDVYYYCWYADKEGYADFAQYIDDTQSDHNKVVLTKAGWEAMKEYYRKWGDYEPDPDEYYHDNY